MRCGTQLDKAQMERDAVVSREQELQRKVFQEPGPALEFDCLEVHLAPAQAMSIRADHKREARKAYS